MLEIPETHRDLLETDVGALATVGEDGFPQVTMLWFLYDTDGEIKLSLNSARRKTRNLLRRPECALLIVDPENPYRYLEIRARARLEPDEDYEFADRLSAKYGGVDLRTRDEPGEIRYEITLEPVRAWAVKLR